MYKCGGCVTRFHKKANISMVYIQILEGAGLGLVPCGVTCQMSKETGRSPVSLAARRSVTGASCWLTF